MYVNFYGRFYGKVDACANGAYQALSPPPLKGPGDEANNVITYFLCQWLKVLLYYVDNYWPFLQEPF